jgi:molecular chaperone HscA
VAVKPSYGLSEDEMARMLYDALQHGAEDMRLRVLTEARVEAERVLTALAAALAVDADLLNPQERQALDEQVAAVRRAMEGEDRDAITAAVEQLETASRPFAERRMDRGIRAALSGRALDELDTTRESKGNSTAGT